MCGKIESANDENAMAPKQSGDDDGVAATMTTTTGASFTATDALHCNRSVNPRDLLHRLCLAASLAPQIVSHMVVEVHAANPRVDYRYNETFADQAILVTVRWHESGRGCRNATCYSTYPKGKACDETTPPNVFMTGKNIAVQACQPACFIRRRQRSLLKRASMFLDQSLFTDNEDPRRCVECDHMNPLIADQVVRRRVDGHYDFWDKRTRAQVIVPPLPLGYHQREAVSDDGEPNVSTDLSFVHWNVQEHRCEFSSETLFRQIAEPYWRAADHNTCRLTNFTQGENVLEGYYSNDAASTVDQRTKDKRMEGFLQGNTETFCRAFGKVLDSETGDCDVRWWETALTYTILGEGVFRLARNIAEKNSGCVDDYFRPTADDLGGPDVEVDPFSARSLREWRADVNLDFSLPPPNVSMLDLGIDVRTTGNRLYWNNFEGVISHMAMFRTVESIVGGGGSGSGSSARLTLAGDDWRDRYANYNVGGGDDGVTSSVNYQPTGDSLLSERFVRLMSAMDDDDNQAVAGGGGDGSGGTSGGKFTVEDVKRMIDHVNDLASRNAWVETLESIGYTIEANWALSQVVSVLKREIKRMMQYILRNLAGRASGAFMRVGVRVGIARVLGSAISQLTAKLIVAGTFASTGIGVVVSVAEVLSALVDVAIVLGWDPGNYNAYTSAQSFRPLMDAFFQQSVSRNRVELRPDTLLDLLLVGSNDVTDTDKTAADGAGTADATTGASEHMELPSFSDENSIDLRVTEARWYNRRWRNCFARDTESLATVIDNTATSSTVSARRQRLDTPRIPLENNRALWTQFYSWYYMGSLQTNSNGQLVRLDRQQSEFNDAELSDLVQEADYRDLTTISAGRDVDNRSYNRRVKRSRALGLVFLGAGAVTAVAATAVTLKETNRSATIFLWSMLLTIVIGIAGLAVVCWNLHVFDDQFLRTMDRLNDDADADAVKNKPAPVLLAKRIDADARKRSISRILRTFRLFT